MGRRAFEEYTQQSIMKKLMVENYIKEIKAKFARPIRPTAK